MKLDYSIWRKETLQKQHFYTKLMIELSATVEVMFTVLTTLFKKYNTPILSIY